MIDFELYAFAADVARSAEEPKQSYRTLACPACGLDAFAGGKTSHVIASLCCPGCGVQMLTEPHIPEDPPAYLPDASEFRAGATRMVEIRRWGAILVWVSLVVAGLLALFGDGFGWFNVFGHFLWPVGLWFAVMVFGDFISPHGWCWHCGDKIVDEIDVVCEFGHCPRCGAQILDGGSDPEQEGQHGSP